VGREEALKIRLISALVLGVLGLTVQAKSATVVYLVGIRHIYSIPAYPDTHQQDRQQIEEDYAAAVADAQKHYDADMASIHDEEAKDSGAVHQLDRDAVQENLEKDVSDAADKRDVALGQIYPICDSVRASHPEFKVEQDGPYKVVEVETAPSGDYTNVVYYQPYPTYIEPCPYGWVWGQPYPFLAWGVQIRLWHSMWITFGCPFYEPMYYGGGVFVFSAPVRSDVIVGRAGWNGGRPPHITDGERTVLNRNYAAQKQSGYFSRGPGGRPLTEFQRPNPTVRLGSRYSNSTGVSRYSHSAQSHSSNGTSATGTSRYHRTLDSGTSPSTGVSKYSHSAGQSSTSRYGRTGTSSSTSKASSSSGANSTSSHSTSGASSSTSHTTTSSGSSGSTTHGSSGSGTSGGSTGHSSGGSGSSSDPAKKKG